MNHGVLMSFLQHEMYWLQLLYAMFVVLR